MPSSVIRRYDYDAALQALTVEFVTGRKYRYAEVPEPIVVELGAAFSKGQYFNQHIRDHFDAVRLG
jgi:hypothetical protein